MSGHFDNLIDACPMCGEPGVIEHGSHRVEGRSSWRVTSGCGVQGKAFALYFGASTPEEAMRLAIDHWNTRNPPKGPTDV